MSEEKKLFPSFKVYSPDDLTKRWFVYWSEGTKRRKKYGDINRHNTIDDRKKAAKAIIRELKSDILRRFSRTEESVRDFIEMHSPNWSKKTREQYNSIANVLFEYLDGREATQELVELFLAEIRKTRHPTTYNKYISISKRLLSAAGYGFIFENIKKVKASPTPARYFQSYQANRLMSEIEKSNEQLALFIRFIYYCFIRPGELRHLKAGDILLEDAQVRVPGEISKNRKTQFVAIPDLFIPHLKPIYEMGPAEYLFPSSLNPTQPASINYMYNQHKKFLKKMNFGKGYSLYSWKHTGAVAAAKAGISVKELQLQLRHHSLDETDRYLRQMGVSDLSRLRAQFPGIVKK